MKSRASNKQPSAKGERWVESRNCQQNMKKNSCDGQGYEHQGNEHYSASGDDPPAAKNDDLSAKEAKNLAEALPPPVAARKRYRVARKSTL